MQPKTAGMVRFAEYALDLCTGELHRNHTPLKLQPQPAKVLVLLVCHAGELLTREELAKQVWDSDVFVDYEQGLNFAIRQIRAALEDDPDHPRFLETIPKRGYRFIAKVEEVAAEAPPLDQSVGTSLIGKKISHYRVLEIIGGGGMGLVFRAEDLKLGRRVALKFLPEELARDSISLQRFEREARTASRLNHPNICTIYEVEEHDGQPCIVMELLEGETLRDRLAAWQTKPIAVDEMLQIGAQVCHGLEAAHQRDIIHRDIKPANIFLTTGDQVKILDFGLAKFIAGENEVVDTDAPHTHREGARAASASADPPASVDHPLTLTGAAMGTAGYMSPEQVRGEKVDARTDIFSFGLVLYEMATGQRAFTGDTAAVVRDGILNDSPAPLRELNSMLPARLVATIDRCLEKDRERRYQSAAEIRSDLTQVLRDSDPRRGADKTADRVPSRRLFWRSLVAVSVVSLLVAAGISAALYRRTKSTHVPRFEVQNMRISRLTDNGEIDSAAISPDGHYLAYSRRETPHKLWVRQVSSERAVEIVASSAESLRGLTFSPDGAYVYFLRGDKGYVIPTLGGTPRQVIEETFGGIGVSPDGTQLAFVIGGDVPKAQLLVANRDGTDQQVIAEHPLSSGTEFHSAGAPAWSPDGRFIALGAARHGQSVLNIYPAQGGPPKVIPLPGLVWRAIWLPDGSGFLLSMGSSVWARSPPQLWLQPFPSGNLQRVTNDLDSYRSLSMSGDGKLLSAVQEQPSLKISVSPVSNPDNGVTIRAGKSDGAALAWLPNGMLFTETTESDFASFTADGKNRVALFGRQLFPEDASGGVPGEFSICNDGHLILAGRHVWRAELTGVNPKQLTVGNNEDDQPDCSPDSQSVIYISGRVNASQLMRVLTDGSNPTLLATVSRAIYSPRFSPDGQQIADFEWDDKGSYLLIRNAKTGQVTKSFYLPEGMETPWNSYGVLRWTPDGRMLTVLLWKGVGSSVNIWGQPVSGGPLRQLTHFPDRVVAYDWSPDGKRLVITRSAPTADVVLISNFH